ncbi:MAG: phosphoribosylamine--glycine ligase [Flavobacteriales bacterium]|jgi:phosphoribosylamine--glycine ligase|nr:MAG: phosphoribosylamine--glycine ligase [Flavobacteriales bacterium]|tara:strand:- start:394 stop:1665 length:1272 start_codon:yes stop_codon:yes gene_type:complete
MNILVLGSGGREHAFAKKIKSSKHCNNLFIAPGNSGTAQVGQNLNISYNNFKEIKNAVLQHQINMVVVGPEDPLVNGIHDFFLNDNDLRDVMVIGPQTKGAQLEGSKNFAKEFMNRHNIPTAAHQTFNENQINEANRFLESLRPPYVLKADGLAAGKGVLIIQTLDEAKKELYKMLCENKFGEASSQVVIEEFLKGVELSCFVITDGESYKILPTAKDYKRIGEGDQGLNTGGMGAISPPPFVDDILMNKIEQTIIKPTIEGLKKDQIPFQGFVFIGLIMVNDDPYVIEYNVRMGDPETEAVLPRIQNDIVEIFESLYNQTLQSHSILIDERSAVTVVVVSGGYPESYQKGYEITGIENVNDSIVFHAGARLDNDKIVTSGGRVLAITSLSENYKEALKTSYRNISKIDFKDMRYRRDIGFDL